MQDSSYIDGNTIQVVAASGVTGAGILPQFAATTTYGAGQFVDIGVVNTTGAQPTVAIVWYDTVSRQLMFTYNTTPNTYAATVSEGQWTNNTWASNTRVIDTDGGQHVKMAIDSDGGVHLAYYNNNGGDLKYAYLSGVTDTSPEVVVVDSFLSTGAKCSIDVARNAAGYQVPHISYQMTSNIGTSASAKYAYRVTYPAAAGASSPVLAGVDATEAFTGDWEVSIIPTNRTPIDDKINIGVHKVWNDAGTRGNQLAIPSGTDTTQAETNAFPVSDSTIIYGNGTLNPAIAYAVEENGVLEMAQKK